MVTSVLESHLRKFVDHCEKYSLREKGREVGGERGTQY